MVAVRAGRTAPPTAGALHAWDHFERAGRKALADEHYDLRCELALVDGERFYTPEQDELMRQRVAALEPLVGDDLNRLLAAEEDA